ncbi:Beta2-adaptin appendage C-terminal sub-domain [Phytophthora infestans]|uniref:Beta2-adaptin appendage C-terminal sub-domain n=1 Tax=Phytophthora infestans TaxID=4787 RepID=A0A833TBF3_PHYIN|nr:Beta2-adaptin appendage C-terminal sub-domain [Phytophthora infestans]
MATGSVMRPSNFRHDKRGAQVVEIRREEYERTKRSILKKIRRRLVILGVIIGLLSVVAFILGGVIRGYYSNIVKFHRVSGHVTLNNLYFIYAAVSLTFSFHGFYIDGKWRKMQQDGNRLIMHVRTFFILGVGSWALALWLGIATLSAFGLVELQYIASSNANIIYLTTLIMITLHLVTSPWLLRTIHRKGSQADEFFGAEFLSDIRRPPKKNGDYDDESSHSDEDDKDTKAAAVQPATTSPRESNRGASQRIVRRQDSAKAGLNTRPMLHLQLAMEGDEDVAPRSPRRQPSARSASPRIPTPVTQSVVGTSPPVDSQGYNQIPFASPVFLMSPDANLAASDFWQLWKRTETTGAFSCTFANQPSRVELEQHLAAHGFRVVAAEQKDSVLQVYFYASQYGTDTFFLCEFVLLFARRFFQATFKCREREAASDFVTRFNLQDLLVVEGE